MKRLIVPPLLFGLAFVVLLNAELLEPLLRTLFPNVREILYARIPLIDLFREHVMMVLVSSVTATVIGVSLGVIVTRPPGRDFLTVVQGLSSFAQTFPPVAVLALAVPAVGFGFRPTIIALVAYSVLPILNNTIAGMEAIPRELTEASRGIGMTPLQVLFLSELPLSARVIAAGIRTSVIINVGTATIGAVVGAGGLGVVIVAGLVRDNIAFVFSGAAAAAVLALAFDWLFGRLETLFFAPRARVSR
ncbi:MAG: ABC transporter permease [Spirochaetaceae bacterium]|nr:MAG: ABC transporter permease [Spirochaetaceae bacterium]